MAVIIIILTAIMLIIIQYIFIFPCIYAEVILSTLHGLFIPFSLNKGTIIIINSKNNNNNYDNYK